MKTAWTEEAWQDDVHWQRNDPKIIAARSTISSRTIKRDPFKGPGKPDPLNTPCKAGVRTACSGEHRLVYRVSGKGETQQLDTVQCRYHY